MKVGILTFHMAHNCGAMLQAYALSKIINHRYNVYCEIIDYRTPQIYNKYENEMKEYNCDNRRAFFEDFLNHTLTKSKRIYSIDEANEYDIFIIGSDQVWNQKILKDNDEIYFAEFTNNKYCISYASSTGQSLSNPQRFSRRLEKFQRISVRECFLQTQLQPYFHKQIQLCVDPVLLFDSVFWSQEFLLDTKPSNNYSLIYSFKLTWDLYLKIQNDSFCNGINTVELFTHKRNFERVDYLVDCYGPKEWINYFKNAKCVYTDSYHGILFSLLFNKPFYCTNNSTENERISDFIKHFQLYKNKDGFYIKSRFTNKLLEKERKNSLSFLDNAFYQVFNDDTKL